MSSGNPIVIDASALLAIYLDEPSAGWVAEQLDSRVGALFMSTVNAAEVMMLLRSRRLPRADEFEASLVAGGIRFVAPTIDHALRAAEARHRFPLNLGDCFAYALSAAEQYPILTLDADFRACDRPLIMP